MTKKAREIIQLASLIPLMLKATIAAVIIALFEDGRDEAELADWL